VGLVRAFVLSLVTLRSLITLAGLACLALAIWFLGPLVGMGLFGSPDWFPLERPGARAATLVILFGVIAAVALLRFWMARRANRRMIASLLETEQMSAIADNRSGEEVEVIRERFQDAMEALRERVFQGRSGAGYISDLPWYIIIGPPGAGKTTILRHSGLDFPLADRMGAEAIQGIGGTRNCDWWFTNQAVIIDTAGRYTTQDTNTELDRAAWVGFLDLLKTYRPRQPVNGVILAISLADVLTFNERDRKRHVEALRKRIQELLRKFGMAIPIYVLLTKADLISGFNEYFDASDEDERRQVWGMTFPVDGAATRITENFDANFKELWLRLERGLSGRMHDERNLRRRAAMFMFPKEFAAARAAIGSFVYEVFRPTRFDATPLLRGVYLTSGTQQGTPIDKLVSELGRSFGLMGGGVKTPFSGQGKAFFINRLLTDVIFEEQGLVGTDRNLERRLAMAQAAGYGIAATIAAVTGLYWYGAFVRSEARVAEVAAAAQVLSGQMAQQQTPLTFTNVLPTLNAARDLKQASGENSLFAWLEGAGLSSAARLGPRATEIYDQLVIGRLMPAFERRMAERLQSLAVSGESPQVRDQLRTYLMLGDPARFDRSVVASAARAELPLAFPVDAQSRTAMSGHVDRMLDLLPRPLPIDVGLVRAGRQRLTREPRTDQIYARLLREAAQNQRLRPIDFASIVGSSSLTLSAARSAQIQRLGIPGIYTKDGFYQFVLTRLPQLVREEQGTDWVLASDQVDDAQFQRVAVNVLDRYVEDYVRNWNGALASVTAIPFQDLPRGMQVLQGLAGPRSPLDAVLQLVKDNADLPPPGEQATGAAQQAASAVPIAGGAAASLVRSASGAALATALGDAPWPGKRISDGLQPLTSLITPSASGAAPIGRVRDLLSTLYGTVGSIANAPEPSLAAYQYFQRRVRDAGSDVFANLRADSALRPEPLRSILRDITNSGWTALLNLAYEHVNEAWKREILPVCEGSISNRYPIVAGAQEDMTLRDFSDFFRNDGILDAFFKKYLEPLVVDQRNGFAPARIDGVALPLRAEALAQFHRARLIRRAFFATAGAAPSVKFSVRPAFLHPQVLRATLSIDGRDIVYRHEPPRAYEIEWPTRTESSSIAVILTLGNATEQRVEQTGPWALFRLADRQRLTSGGSAERFRFQVGPPNGPRVVYELRAASVSNPFNPDVLRAFRCPDRL
jgi:type VI secretion system protein ImpL